MSNLFSACVLSASTYYIHTARARAFEIPLFFVFRFYFLTSKYLVGSQTASKPGGSLARAGLPGPDFSRET